MQNSELRSVYIGYDAVVNQTRWISWDRLQGTAPRGIVYDEDVGINRVLIFCSILRRFRHNSKIKNFTTTTCWLSWMPCGAVCCLAYRYVALRRRILHGGLILWNITHVAHCLHHHFIARVQHALGDWQLKTSICVPSRSDDKKKHTPKIDLLNILGDFWLRIFPSRASITEAAA